jgi:hypothetical protein
MMLEPGNRFYNDLSPDEQKHWISELVRCPTSTQVTPLTYEAFLYHPVTYLFCENDQGLPIFLQQAMVKSIEEQKGISIKRETCDSGHSPFLSQPETILKLVDAINK